MRGSYPEGLKMALFVHYMFNIFVSNKSLLFYVYTDQNTPLKIIFV